MQTMQELSAAIPTIESNLHYTFKNHSFLLLAFTHCSFINEHREVTEHNERLEFLGDSVLGLIISDYLYKERPSMPEGEMSHYRSRLVEAASCVRYIQKLDVNKYLLLGKGERMNTVGKGRDSILSDLFEAIVGAIYLDGGMEAARTFLFHHFHGDIEEILKTPLKNWKALFQEYVQKSFQKSPIYHVLETSGPDHSKHFIVAVVVGEQEFGRGSGFSKKEAQQAAAENALINLQNKTT